MRTRTILLTLVCCALAMSGCGDDDPDDATDAAASTPAAAGDDQEAEEAGECEPVNADMEGDADQVVEVTLSDFAFNPVSMEVDAGTVTFATTNEGGSVHEFAVLPGGGDVPFVEEGVPDEDALEAAGAFEMEGYGPGGTCNATWELEPGEYTLFCIIEASDGLTHYEKGMAGSLTVRG
ncbi:MAG TPA: hypothetical protein VJ978_00840 [Nitriliruptoraceae bacterium]|nr:hypothetical protein [Nitriliruptoraceae bacterium]